MKLRAQVRRVTGATRHFEARVSKRGESTMVDLPSPSFVEIEPAGKAFSLLYMTPHGECLTDTWHRTLEQAKAQARHEFDIAEDDWKEVEA
jgi:hypothetical protein